MNELELECTLFPKGVKAPSEYFTENTWLNMLLPNEAPLNCQVANVVFEPGNRTNWHTHLGGQILIVTNGTGYYQERGKPVQIISKGDVISIAPKVEHWHGATHDNELIHIAINPNAQRGVVDWLERVSEEDYNQ